MTLLDEPKEPTFDQFLLNRVAAEPTMPTEEEIVRWLKSKRLSLWGSYFLMEKERPQACAEWILEQVTGFLEWRRLGSPDEPVRKHGYERISHESHE